MTTNQQCQVCGAELSHHLGRKPKFCGTRCRVKSHRGHQIPVELRQRDRWIRHSRKVPITVTGQIASSTNPATWSDYQTATAAMVGDGLGFVLNGDGIVCIDLDHCFDGSPSAEAQAVIDSLPETYIEVSPSGTGLHIWGYANMDKGRRFTQNGLSVEVYPNGRYLTVTGKALTRARFAQLDLSQLLAKS